MSCRASQNLLTFTPLWHLIDAKGQPAGRVAVRAAHLLMGKHKPIFHPSVNVGDHVVIINAKEVALSGKKWDQKLYRYHTMYPGGLKETAAKDLLQKTPTDVMRKAVYGMMPKNSLRQPRMRRLHLFEDAEHPFAENVGQNIVPTIKVFGATRGGDRRLPMQVELLDFKM